MSDDLFFQEKKGRKLYFIPVLKKGKRSHTDMYPEEIAMRKARFIEHQIIAVLKSVEVGRTVKDVCREAGISEASYYNWKAKYGGMEASDKL